MDQQLFFLINGWAGHNAFLDTLMIFSARYLIYILFAVGAGFALYYLYKKEYRRIVLFGATLVLAYILLQLISMLYVNERPYVEYDNVTQLVAREAGRSFASNHTASAFAFALGIFTFFNRKVGIFCIVAASIIAFARIFTGLHHPIDIAGAIFVATLATVLVHFGDKLLQKRFANHKQKSNTPTDTPK